MEIKGLPVAKKTGAILLMALSTNALAVYNCYPTGFGRMQCQGAPDYQVAPPRGAYQGFMDALRRGQEHRLLDQELELRQLELEQRRKQLVDQELQKEWQQLEEYKRRRQTDKQPKRPQIFGARVVPLPGRSQGNTGAFVAAVAQGGPAFKANIMRGDVIVGLAGKPVATVDDLIIMLPTYAGQKVPVRINRGTRTLDIDVQLSEGY